MVFPDNYRSLPGRKPGSSAAASLGIHERLHGRAPAHSLRLSVRRRALQKQHVEHAVLGHADLLLSSVSWYQGAVVDTRRIPRRPSDLRAAPASCGPCIPTLHVSVLARALLANRRKVAQVHAFGDAVCLHARGGWRGRINSLDHGAVLCTQAHGCYGDSSCDIRRIACVDSFCERSTLCSLHKRSGC